MLIIALIQTGKKLIIAPTRKGALIILLFYVKQPLLLEGITKIEKSHIKIHCGV